MLYCLKRNIIKAKTALIMSRVIRGTFRMYRCRTWINIKVEEEEVLRASLANRRRLCRVIWANRVYGLALHHAHAFVCRVLSPRHLSHHYETKERLATSRHTSL
ncbi:hypothetical protein ElyMa_006488300 [Elysia marginata]|uniref:Uncharacterized protein n=1 Tax=Elysia marginata TaxID=1093978 RepID=A0AAV4I0X1_9GAST|nr:hypothetical protein ElyMa_006488300 [Elysia marginata]